jgi:hypothetical protein
MGRVYNTNEIRKKKTFFFFFGLENLKGMDHLENLGVYGRIISEWILEKKDGKV